ncbi:MAG: type II toxin-antitoxin system VapC family toxin, partial [Oscillospiraceae bacterium]
SFVEISAVLSNYSDNKAILQLDALLHRAKIEILDVTTEQAHIARQAYIDFGKGRHSAGLNFGDCFSYALAKARNEPLLFKGNDFAKTDVLQYLKEKSNKPEQIK